MNNVQSEQTRLSQKTDSQKINLKNNYVTITIQNIPRIVFKTQDHSQLPR